MPEKSSDTIYSDLAAFLHSYLGFSFAENKISEIKEILNQTATQLDIEPDYLAKRIINNRESDEYFSTFLDNLRINETYFFRENETLNMVCDKAAQISRLRKPNIWCIASSTGEEPYSVSMILQNKYPSVFDSVDKILATDINLNSIRKARKAEYSKWSFRNTPENIQQKYFTKENEKFILSKEIKSKIDFQFHNLVNSPYHTYLGGATGFDIILCRNVFIYFTSEVRGSILQKLHSCLKPGGYLFLGLTEISFANLPGLKKMVNNNVIFFQTVTTTSKIPNKIIAVSSTQIPLEPVSDSDINCNQLNPDNDTEKTVNLFSSGNYEECLASAYRQLTRIIEEKPKSFVLNKELIGTYINSSINLSRTSEAIVICERLIELDKSNPYLYLLLANLFVHSNQNEEAIDNLVKAIYLNADYISAHLLLGKLFLSTKLSSDGIRHYKYAQKLLDKLPPDTIIEDTDGFSAETLKNIIDSILSEKGIIQKQ